MQTAEIVKFPRHPKSARRLTRRRSLLDAQAARLPKDRVIDLSGFSIRAALDLVQTGEIEVGGLVLVDRLLGIIREVVQIKINSTSREA